jgi:hypothetical protein
MATALTGLLTALVTVLAPGGAYAEPGNPCENPTMGDFREIVYDPIDRVNYYVVMWMKSWERTFNVAGFDTDGNDTDGTSPKTFTVTESREFTIQTTHKATATIQAKFWKITLLGAGYEYSQQVTDKHTTSSSVSRTITMAPHTALRAYNGVDAINGIFDIATWLRSSDGRCWWRPEFTEYNVRRNVPTNHERWELQQLPTINPGGVVNPQDWSYNIHPCTTVAIFGNGFAAPNTIIVRQNGNTWNIGAGSPWWWEGNGQINATLPCGLQPNAYASISVKSNKTIEFIETLWPRFVYITP